MFHYSSKWGEIRLKNINLKSLWEILFVSTRLGLTSFGGPVAHLGYFREEYVQRRKWLSEKSYADLVALCQFLPGPASSQVGIGLGVIRAGILGGVLAFIGFTLPSVIALIVFASMTQTFDLESAGWIHGLKIVAVAIVLHAVVGMAKNLTPDWKRKAIAFVATVSILLWQTTISQILVIIVAGFAGLLLFKKRTTEISAPDTHFPISRRLGIVFLTVFFSLLIILPILKEVTNSSWIAFIDSFYRSGALVFGGGHVVLPLLEREFVPLGLLTEQEFLAGYGATQAVPGPLFTFAAYLGTVMHGWQGGVVATFAIFLPAFLLVIGALPFWHTLRENAKISGAFMGVNAAVVGILIAAFFQPIWTSSIFTITDFCLAIILFSLLYFWKLPPWMIVVAGAAAGMLF